MAVERSVASVLQNMFAGWWGVKSGTTDTAQLGYFTDGAGWVLEKGIALSPQGQSAGQSVSISGTSAQSTAITGTQVDLVADTACSIAIGTNPTAVVATSYRIPANVAPIRLGIVSGSKIAVIGTSGTLYISPVGEAA